MVLDQLELSLLWLGPHVIWACSLAGLMVMVAETPAALPSAQPWAVNCWWETLSDPTLLQLWQQHWHSPTTCCTTGLQTAGATLAKAALSNLRNTTYCRKPGNTLLFHSAHSSPGSSVLCTKPGSHTALSSPWKQQHIWHCGLCPSFYQPQH